jgi:hypothetical protein
MAKGKPDGSTQPPQTSGHGPAPEHRETVRRGYEAAREPERQPDGDPGPMQTVQDSSTQDDGKSKE